eukprot:PhF_6_TR42754/c0_g1_i2/m.64644/K14693/SLC30A6, ZNT6; solute carrier family 30 (zinc transporter), member 6
MKLDTLIWAYKLLRRDREYAWLTHYTIASIFVALPTALLVSLWSSALTLTVAAFIYLHQTIGCSIRLLCRVLCTERASNPEFSYGYARLQELLVYANACVLIFAAFSCIIEGTHRYFESHDIHPGFVSSTAIMLAVFSCWAVLASFKEPINAHSMGPLIIMCSRTLGGPIAVLVSLSFPDQDVLIGGLVALHAMYSMIPHLIKTGAVLLQAFPVSVKPAIDNALRAAASTDGVLEVRDEHFWSVSDGILVGTVTLRLRWDANECNVTAEVSQIFDSILSHCTIHVQKERWDPTKATATVAAPTPGTVVGLPVDVKGSVLAFPPLGSALPTATNMGAGGLSNTPWSINPALTSLPPPPPMFAFPAPLPPQTQSRQ